MSLFGKYSLFLTSPFYLPIFHLFLVVIIFKVMSTPSLYSLTYSHSSCQDYPSPPSCQIHSCTLNSHFVWTLHLLGLSSPLSLFVPFLYLAIGEVLVFLFSFAALFQCLLPISSIPMRCRVVLISFLCQCSLSELWSFITVYVMFPKLCLPVLPFCWEFW
jgi:hypothetical protein